MRSSVDPEKIALMMDAAFRARHGGHNGICVESGQAQVYAEPWWSA